MTLLLGSAPLVVELRRVTGFPPKNGHSEADPWRQLAHVLFYFGFHLLWDLPGGRLMPEIVVRGNRLLRWALRGTGQQMLDLTVQSSIGRQPNGMEVAVRLRGSDTHGDQEDSRLHGRTAGCHHLDTGP